MNLEVKNVIKFKKAANKSLLQKKSEATFHSRYTGGHERDCSPEGGKV